MSKYQKPQDPNIVWGANALSGNLVKPDSAKVEQGWLQEKPPLETFNWLVNKLFLAYAYYNQLGIPEWDRDTEYQAGRSYVQGPDGVVYKALVNNINQNPAGSGRDRWEVAFVENRAVSTYGRSLVAATNAAQARQILALGSASNQSDDRYLHRASNLNDLPNKLAAFTNIKQDASHNRTGVVQLATRQEVLAGERDDVVVTPFGLGGGINPSGTIIHFAGSEAPEGYLLCDGRLLSRAAYPALFSQIGTTWGNTNSSNFRIPDARGMFLRGWDSGRGVDPNRQFGSQQADMLGSHNHTGSTSDAGDHHHTGNTGNAGAHTHTGNTSSSGAHAHNLSINSGGAHSHTGSTNSSGTHQHISNYPGDENTGPRAPYGSAPGSTTVKNTTGGSRSYGNVYVSPEGAHTHTITLNSAGSHSHTGTAESAGDHSHNLSINSAGDHSHNLSINSAGSHNHNFTTNNSGGSETRPVNIAVLICIKT